MFRQFSPGCQFIRPVSIDILGAKELPLLVVCSGG
jgi:hypothetical protein